METTKQFFCLRQLIRRDEINLEKNFSCIIVNLKYSVIQSKA